MGRADQRRLFKKVTPENWRDHDGTADHIVRIADTGCEEISENEWAALILETELTENVPVDVRNLFEVAQGVMCYGCHFYPLYTLGCEQLYRVMEAAVQHRCVQCDAPAKLRNFKARLEWLCELGYISESNHKRMDAARDLRNMSSHASRQSLCSPDQAIGQLRISAELIESLFR